MSAASAAATDGRPVLVTGGAGFLGSHLVARLLAAGRRVVVLDDLSTGLAANLPRHAALQWLEASVLDAAAVAEAARGVSAVWHLAGVVGMQRATRLAKHAHRVSAEGTRLVLAATGDAPVVLFSSSAVYGLQHADPAREDQPADAGAALEYDGGSPGYASGKLALEALGLAAAAAGRRVLIVRPFNVVGPRQSSAYGMVLPTFVQRALAGRELIIHGDGRQTRAFSDVGTFLDAALALAASDAAWRAPHPVFNVGSPSATSVLQLAQLVRQTCHAHGASSAAEGHDASDVSRVAAGSGDVPLRFVPYAEAYPGRRDVPARSPDPARLRAVIGEVSWPGIAEIVRGIVAAECSAPTAPILPSG